MMNRRLRGKIARINLSHDRSINEKAIFTSISETQWSISSVNKPSQVYTVEKIVDEEGNEVDLYGSCWECESDGLCCAPCGICIHSYSCTCPDYEENENICKHIHRIVKAGRMDVNKTPDSDSRNNVSRDSNVSMSWMESEWEKLMKRHHDKSVNTHVEITKLSESEWLVSSTNDPCRSRTVVVKYNGAANCLPCKNRDRCSTCVICIHSYSCSCPDYRSDFPICSHIHKVANENSIDVKVPASVDTVQ